MSSPAQILANQQNAQLSTGPRTAAGKAIASLNALCSGVYSDALHFSSPEKKAAFEALLAGFLTDHQPIDDREHDCVYQFAKARWLQIAEDRQLSAYLLQLEARILEEIRKQKLDPGQHLDARLFEAKANDKALRAGLRRARELRGDANRALRTLRAYQEERKQKAREDARQRAQERKMQLRIEQIKWEKELREELTEGMDLPPGFPLPGDPGFVPAPPLEWINRKK